MTDMRSLINLITVLSESRGLGARKPGEEFVSNTNPEDKIYLQSVEFYPQGQMAYPSHEEAMAAVSEVSEQLASSTVNLVGKFKNTDNAFGVAIFERPGGEQLAFIKPFKTIKMDPTENPWSNQDGIPGYRYNSKTAAKSQAGMTPQDILTSPSNLTPNDIVAQIADKFGLSSPLTKVAKAMASGQKLPISIPAPADLSFTAFRDYFCELMHPIALHTGNYKGNAGDAAAQFLGVGGFADTSINFGNDKTEGLSDSILIGPDGKKIKVSSKGSKGAEASARNLMDAARELAESNPRLAKKHKETIDMVSDLAREGQANAPLLLGEKYNIITSEDADAIRGFKNMPLTSLEAVKKMKISKGLKTLIMARGTKEPDNVNLYYHAIAAVAHKAAEHVNDTTNFSKAASEILNNGALIQVYTKASEAGGKWTITSFDTIWPSNTVTGVKFSAGKTYYSTGIKGNFTFKILRNGAKDVEDERSTEPAIEPKSKSKKATEPETHAVTGLRPRGVEKAPSKKSTSLRQRR